MVELAEEIRRLAQKHFADRYRNRDRESLSAGIVHLATTEKAEDIFGAYNERDFGEVNKDFKLLRDILNRSRDSHEYKWLSENRDEISKTILHDVLEIVSEEARLNEATKRSFEKDREIADLRAKLEFGKTADKVTFLDQFKAKVNFPYVIILCIAFLVIGGIIALGVTAKMSISVVFNIGEIIGAVLVGTGAAVAGISYARKGVDEARRNER